MSRVPSPAIAKFVDRLGLAAEAEGLPRIAGRIMAFLLADGAAHNAADLAALLHVSRGSISTNTRLLERLGIIERRVVRATGRTTIRSPTIPSGACSRGSWEGRMRQIEHLVSETIGAIGKSSSATAVGVWARCSDSTALRSSTTNS